MSKSKLLIFIIIIVSIAVGIISGIYFYTKKTNETIQPTVSDKTIFGGVGGVRKDLPTDNTNNPTAAGNEIDKPVSTSTPEAPILRMIASGPISGADFVTRNVIASSTLNQMSLASASSTSTSTSTKKTKTIIIKPKILGQEEKIRYQERGTGWIFEASTSTIPTTRISNSTFIRLNESFFDKMGDNLLLRGLLNNSDVIQTRIGSLSLDTPTSTEMSLKTKDLPYNLLSVVMSPAKDYFASYIEQKGIGSSINVSRIDGTGVFNIYKSAFREWLLSWPTINTIVLNTKPSAYSAGYAYSIDTKSKAFRRITGGQNGLTTLVSPDGLNVLVGETIDGSMKLSVLNLKTQSYKDVFARTLPEKCIWSKLEKSTIFCAASESIVYAPYPDAWYQGLIFFDDNVWKINVDTLENHLIVVPKSYVKDGLDITNMSLDKNEDYMLFTNKKDLSLWGLQLPSFKVQKATTTSSTPKTKTSVRATSTAPSTKK